MTLQFIMSMSVGHRFVTCLAAAVLVASLLLTDKAQRCHLFATALPAPGVPKPGRHGLHGDSFAGLSPAKAGWQAEVSAAASAWYRPVAAVLSGPSVVAVSRSGSAGGTHRAGMAPLWRRGTLRGGFGMAAPPGAGRRRPGRLKMRPGLAAPVFAAPTSSGYPDDLTGPSRAITRPVPVVRQRMLVLPALRPEKPRDWRYHLLHLTRPSAWRPTCARLSPVAEQASASTRRGWSAAWVLAVAPTPPETVARTLLTWSRATRSMKVSARYRRYVKRLCERPDAAPTEQFRRKRRWSGTQWRRRMRY